jgi:hypothetical protein
VSVGVGEAVNLLPEHIFQFGSRPVEFFAQTRFVESDEVRVSPGMRTQTHASAAEFHQVRARNQRASVVRAFILHPRINPPERVCHDKDRERDAVFSQKGERMFEYAEVTIVEGDQDAIRRQRASTVQPIDKFCERAEAVTRIAQRKNMLLEAGKRN